MSYQILLTIQDEPGMGIILMARTVRPGLMDTRLEDEVRMAVLNQAAVQSREMIDKEVLPGDPSFPAALPTPEFTRAVMTLASYGMLEADVDLELDGEEAGDDGS
jgi:hypothetical protein